MDIDVQEVIAELQRQFPKELTICAQAVQIRMLQEKAEPEESGGGADA